MQTFRTAQRVNPKNSYENQNNRKFETMKVINHMYEWSIAGFGYASCLRIDHKSYQNDYKPKIYKDHVGSHPTSIFMRTLIIFNGE